MLKKLIYLGIVLGFSHGLHAQNYSEILKLTQLNDGTTARTMGVAGAFGAMGGDYGSLAINPAGLGDYRKSEFIFSPVIRSYSNDATLEGNSPRNTTGSGFGILNLGVVFSNNTAGSSWQTSNFSIGLSQINNFSEEFAYEGTTPGSITERFLELGNFAGSVDALDNFEAGLAWDVGALYFDTNENFVTDFPTADTRVFKEQFVRRSGRINQLDFAWGGNLNNKVNFGVSAGVPFFTFEETKVYEEIDQDGSVPFFERLQFTEFINTSGVGFNLKVGTVLKPTRNIRIGAAIHSPTWYSVDDSYNNSLEYVYNDNGIVSNSVDSPTGAFDYRINTTWRAIGSVGGIFRVGALRGFVNADFEYLDYRNGNFNLTENSTDPDVLDFELELNQQIDTELNSALNVRLGTELGYDIWRFRGGVALNGSPYSIDDQSSNNQVYSLGFGLRQDRFFLDVAYQLSKTEEGYIPFVVLEESAQQFANVEGTRSNIALTAGFKF